MSKPKKTDIRGDTKERLMGHFIAVAMKLWSMTLRYHVNGQPKITAPAFPADPILFTLWHNRIFTMPPIWSRTGGKNRKSAVLTSASKDGTTLATAMEFFGLDAIRGSSSRRAVSALIGMKKALQNGTDICITPDGPRGPRYQVQPGVIKIAQATGANIVPIHIRYQCACRLKTWDKFVLPIPFSKVTVTFDPARKIPKGICEEQFETERLSLESCLLKGTDDSHL
ncbi:MAG: lysophospholipid acyltransferase family protein [Luteolibacter sp.]